MMLCFGSTAALAGGGFLFPPLFPQVFVGRRFDFDSIRIRGGPSIRFRSMRQRQCRRAWQLLTALPRDTKPPRERRWRKRWGIIVSVSFIGNVSFPVIFPYILFFCFLEGIPSLCFLSLEVVSSLFFMVYFPCNYRLKAPVIAEVCDGR